MKNCYRDMNMSNIGEQNIGEKIKLAGWVENIRDHGGVMFLDIRDQYGVTQVVVHDDALLEGVRARSAYIFDQLTGAPGVESVSGMGLMIGVKTVKPAGDVVKACMEQGVLCLTAKDKVRLLPALNIPEELLAKAVAVIKAACAA